jgi:acyl-CoA thioesterase I
LALALALALLCLGGFMPISARADSLRLAALGDSLTAGWGLPAGDAFPAQLENALVRKGYRVTIANFGVSGDTTAGGLARLDAVLVQKPDGVIVELGANDMLRGLEPEEARHNLDAILSRLTQAGIPVLLGGMRAPKNYGQDYAADFEAIYPELAAKYKAVLYPFFLDGVSGRPDRTQPDGLHPNAAGVSEIVSRILPTTENFLTRLGATPKTAAP